MYIYNIYVILYIYGEYKIFMAETNTKYTVMYSVYIQLWQILKLCVGSGFHCLHSFSFSSLELRLV
jgi:hypothetical protein